MDLVAVGKISKPIGYNGKVKVIPLTSNIKRFSGLKSVWIGNDDISAKRFNIIAAEILTKHVVLYLGDKDNATSYAEMQNMYVFVSREQVIEPTAGSYFIDDIIGCEVVTEESNFVGTIEDLYILPANDVWVVKNGSKEILIPAVEAIVRKIDIKSKCITIKALEGLFD